MNGKHYTIFVFIILLNCFSSTLLFSQSYGQCTYNSGNYNTSGTCFMFSMHGKFIDNHISHLYYNISSDKELSKVEFYSRFENSDFNLLATNSNIYNKDNTHTYEYLDTLNRYVGKIYYKIIGFDNDGNSLCSSNIVVNAVRTYH